MSVLVRDYVGWLVTPLIPSIPLDMSPRMTLGELDDGFGVSRSVVSQLLNPAEAKVVEGFLD